MISIQYMYIYIYEYIFNIPTTSQTGNKLDVQTAAAQLTAALGARAESWSATEAVDFHCHVKSLDGHG